MVSAAASNALMSISPFPGAPTAVETKICKSTMYFYEMNFRQINIKPKPYVNHKYLAKK